MRGRVLLTSSALVLASAAAASTQGHNGAAASSVPIVERQPYDTPTFMATLTLSDAEMNGRLLVAQRCANCHGGNARQPGPPLGKPLVDSRGEAIVREKVMKGSPLMPGFQFTLRPAQVDDIVAFLKTYVPPAPRQGAGQE